MGDHAGHIVYDDTTGEFIIGVSTWGDFTYQGVEIYHTRVKLYLPEDIEVLHGVHVLDGARAELPTALPTPPTGNWDPHFTRIGQEWYVAFVESPTQGETGGTITRPWLKIPSLSLSQIQKLCRATLAARRERKPSSSGASPATVRKC